METLLMKQSCPDALMDLSAAGERLVSKPMNTSAVKNKTPAQCFSAQLGFNGQTGQQLPLRGSTLKSAKPLGVLWCTQQSHDCLWKESNLI